MQEQTESMVGSQHFSCINLKSGFWQVKMVEESLQYTALTMGTMGIYKFPWMPFGPCNVPAMFQHLMQNCLGELNLTYTLIYLDDVITFSCTPEEHLIQLRAMLEQFLEHGLKLKPSKCSFFRGEIDYLGHKDRQPMRYRSGTVNSNTVNSKFHLIRSYCDYLARILSFHV